MEIPMRRLMECMPDKDGMIPVFAFFIFILCVSSFTFWVMQQVFPPGDMGCDRVAEARKKWMNTPPTNQSEVVEEIIDLTQPNKCDGITPDSLRKMLLDIVAVRP